tara:strand:+ start:20399 stop:20995 length:597 start_codon:yes stop_codon:yes gene_type:complete
MQKLEKFVVYFIIVLVILCVVGLLPCLLSNKSMQSFENIKNTTFEASTQYADVSFTTTADRQTLFITVNYKNLADVSALHIHTNNKGSPGPIIAWLGTTNQWQHGVVQNKSGKNSPCCSVNNPLCTLAAPFGTPRIKDLSNTVRTFTVTNSCGPGCPWIEDGTILVVHGYNFQSVVHGKLTNKKPGIDPIAHVPFTAK